MQPTIGYAEKIADGVLFILITFPFFFLLAAGKLCEAEPGSFLAQCEPEILGSIYNPIVFLLTFGLIFTFIFIAPFFLGAALISIIEKVRRYTRGYRPRTVADYAWEFLRFLPFLIVGYILLLIFFSPETTHILIACIGLAFLLVRLVRRGRLL